MYKKISGNGAGMTVWKKHLRTLNAWNEDSGSYLAVKEKKFKEIARINKNRKKGKGEKQ